jgi:hypothetical protein
MTAAHLLQYFILIVLGIFAFITFLVAGTILGLMIYEDSRCACFQYPIGLWVLGFFWLLLLIGLIIELVNSPLFTIDWMRANREALILALVILLALIIIL